MHGRSDQEQRATRKEYGKSFLVICRWNNPAAKIKSFACRRDHTLPCSFNVALLSTHPLQQRQRVGCTGRAYNDHGQLGAGSGHPGGYAGRGGRQARVEDIRASQSLVSPCTPTFFGCRKGVGLPKDAASGWLCSSGKWMLLEVSSHAPDAAGRGIQMPPLQSDLPRHASGK